MEHFLGAHIDVCLPVKWRVHSCCHLLRVNDACSWKHPGQRLTADFCTYEQRDIRMANCIKLLKYSGAFRASLWKFIRLKQQKQQISLCCWRALYACMCWRVLDLHVCVYIFCILDLQGRVGKRAQCKRHRLPWTWSIPASSSQGKLFVVWSTNKGKKKEQMNK